MYPFMVGINRPRVSSSFYFYLFNFFLRVRAKAFIERYSERSEFLAQGRKGQESPHHLFIFK